MSTPEIPDAASAVPAPAPAGDVEAGEPTTAPTAELAPAESTLRETDDASLAGDEGAADLTPPAPTALPPAYDGYVAPVPAATAPRQAEIPAAPVAPRVRWAAIVWGLVLAAIAATGLWILTDAARQAAVTTWMLELTPAAAVAYVVLVIGGFALIAGIVGLARRAQRGLERRRPASSADRLRVTA